MDLDIAEFAIKHATSLGAKYADVRLETTRKNDFILKNGVPQIAGFDRVHGLGIKIKVNNCFGFASTNELETEMDKETVKKMVEKAVRITRQPRQTARARKWPPPPCTRTTMRFHRK